MRTMTVIVLFFLLFGGLCTGAQFLGARVSGWALLARAYRSSRTFQGAVWRLPSCRLIRMRWEGFAEGLDASFPFLPLDVPDEALGSATGELTVGANLEGLYLAERHVVFRPGHPPLFVPWGDVAVSPRRVRWTEEVEQQISGRFWPAEQGPHAGADAWVLDYLVFRFRQAPGVFLQLRESDGRPLAAAAGSSWPGSLQTQVTLSPSNE